MFKTELETALESLLVGLKTQKEAITTVEKTLNTAYNSVMEFNGQLLDEVV